MTVQNEGGSTIEWTEVPAGSNGWTEVDPGTTSWSPASLWLVDTGFWNDDGFWIDSSNWNDNPIWNEVSTGDRTD